jgi:starch synthase
VRATGGLADTVRQYDPATGEGTGFVFEHFTADGLRWALRRALQVYDVPKAWRRLQLNGMAADFSWGVRARQYEELYRTIASPAEARR